jgi:hypothetical protein
MLGHLLSSLQPFTLFLAAFHSHWPLSLELLSELICLGPQLICVPYQMVSGGMATA